MQGQNSRRDEAEVTDEGLAAALQELYNAEAVEQQRARGYEQDMPLYPSEGTQPRPEYDATPLWAESRRHQTAAAETGSYIHDPDGEEEFIDTHDTEMKPTGETRHSQQSIELRHTRTYMDSGGEEGDMHVSTGAAASGDGGRKRTVRVQRNPL